MTLPKRRGTNFEYRVLYRLKAKFPDARRVVLSGGGSEKGDIKTDRFLIECKKTMYDSIRITKDWLRKIERQAGSKIPLLIFGLKRSEPYVVMRLDDFLSLVRDTKKLIIEKER